MSQQMLRQNLFYFFEESFVKSDVLFKIQYSQFILPFIATIHHLYLILNGLILIYSKLQDFELIQHYALLRF